MCFGDGAGHRRSWAALCDGVRHERRAVGVPVGEVLVGVADAEDGGFIEWATDQLEADGEVVAEAAWDDEAGNACKVERECADIGEVHGEGIVNFCADGEGDGGGSGGSEEIDLFKDALEVAPDEGAHLLGAAVVGVVVSCGEGVGAEHDTAAYFGTEACAACFCEFVPVGFVVDA